ncbi:MAG: hypothetical protein SOX70_00420 [Peptoniphilaceae bacterium]|nr:hypothetical protein [Peptoniphilaceae bacterium]
MQIKNNYTENFFLNFIFHGFPELKTGYFLNYGFSSNKFRLTASAENGILIKIFSFHFIKELIFINHLAKKNEKKIGG